MPFIDNNFKITSPIQNKRILLTTADDSSIYKTAENLARFLQDQGQSILLIDGDLGNGPIENPSLSKVLNDKAALVKAIKINRHLAILGGHAEHSLAQNSDIFKTQFLSDLQICEANYDRIIVAIGSQNKKLQDLWLDWVNKTFLFFRNENIFLEKTAKFLSKHHQQVHGLIGLDSNSHKTCLSWIRLKGIIPQAPNLILDIKKIVL